MTQFVVIDDDAVFRQRLCESLKKKGFAATGAEDECSALAACRDAPAAHIVLDLRLAQENGLDLIPHLRRVSPRSRIVVLTGFGSIPTALEALRRGAANYLTKPASLEQIIRAFDDQTAQQSPPPVPSLEEVEWEHIQRVLHECDGNISQTATLLGMHRRSLQRKLAKNPPPRRNS